MQKNINSITMDKPKSLFSNQTVNALMDFDISIPMSPNEQRLLFEKTVAADQTSLLKNSYSLSITSPNVSEARDKTNLLYSHFLEILQGRTNDSEIFDTIQDLIQACTDTIEGLSKVRKGTAYVEAADHKDLTWLIQERNTWRLLYCLYKDRLIVQKEAADYDDLPLLGSETMIVEHLYNQNANLREYQLIVDWLELCAFEQGTPHVGHYTDRTVAWENTLHQLQNLDQSVFSGRKEIVRELDPDAPHREKRPLHDLDAEDELRLSKQILQELRQGRIEDAQSLCEYCGQPWRAAMLEGWRLHHDPNYEKTDPWIKDAIEGNPRRDLWKKLAWRMADNKSLDTYNRAIIGILCGHLESMVEPLQNSWADLLWAYLKVQIDIRVESEIRSCSMKSYVEMPEDYWKNKMSLEQIFNELNAHKNPIVRKTANNSINIIQKYLILDDIPEMMRNIDTWISNAKVDSQMLRFFTHVVLFMRQVGRQHQEDIAEKIIKTYVESLIELGEMQPVAFYTAAVSHNLQVTLYSKYLQTLSVTVDRKTALDEALNVGLDVYGITCYTVEIVRNQQEDKNNQQQLQGEMSALDASKISVLEWLTFYPQQKGELLWQTNAMIRTFLAESKLECVRKAFKMVPANSIQQIVAHYGSKDNLPRKEECGIKEYLCHQTYLSAIDGYNEWTRLYYSKPKEPQLAAANANFTERIASQHKEHAFRGELERWKINLCEQTKMTKDLLYNVLLFPGKGYLVDPDCDQNIPTDENELWENRSVQLENLRKLCIPEIVLLLHKVLHLAGEFKECVKLADQLVFEGTQLYTVFSRQKLREVIGKLAESSMALMNNRLDPWGYTTAI